MISFLYVITFYVWDIPNIFRRDIPNIFRVFSERVSGKLSRMRSLEVFFTWILCSYTHGVKIKRVLVLFSACICVPHYDFVSTREAPLRMQPMTKMPNDTVSQLQFLLLENWGEL